MGIATAQPPSAQRRGARELDVTIIGAGPVGLAIAIDLSRAGLSVMVVDRRPPLALDEQRRPQLLVARAGDLANLVHLGVDIGDPWIVSMLATRVERDLASGKSLHGEVPVHTGAPAPAADLWTLASQPPLALVPIGRLQQALLVRARELGVSVRYDCNVTRLRRHARTVSLTCEDGSTALAGLAIIATGAARSLIGELPALGEVVQARTQRLIGGLFDVGADRGRWVRAELPVPGLPRPARCTMLQTPFETSAGTALIVDSQVEGGPTPEQLHHCFDAAARLHGLAGAPCLVPPQIFATAVTAMPRRFLGLDGRAPIVVAGDAAQTGHVFSGQTCFVNIALARRLCEELHRAQASLVDRKVNAAALARALTRYDAQSGIGAAILARASARHYAAHPSGAWALAGVARA